MRRWICYISLFLGPFNVIGQKDTVEFYLVGSTAQETGVDLIKYTDSTFLMLINSGANLFDENANPQIIEISDRGVIHRAISVGTYGSERGNQLLLVGDSTVLICGVSNGPTLAYQGFLWSIGLNGTKHFEKYYSHGADWSEVSNLLLNDDVVYGFIEFLSDDSKKIDIVTLSLPSGTQLGRKSLEGTEGFHLESVKRSVEGGFIGCGSFLANNDSLDGFLIKWDEDFDTSWVRLFSKPGNDGYYGVDQLLDSSYVVVGFSDGYFEEDEDIVIHKYDTTGQLLFEEIQGHNVGIDNKNDRALNVSVLNGDTIFLTGYTETYGEGNKEAFMSRLDTAFQNLFGSTTMGTPGNEVSYKILPHKRGVVGVGYSDHQTNGLEDALFWVRKEFQNLETGVTEVLVTYELTDTITGVREATAQVPVRLLMDHVGNTFCVRFPENSKARVSLEVFSIEGRLVHTDPFYVSGTPISLDAGAYVVALTYEKIFKTFKVLLF